MEKTDTICGETQMQLMEEEQNCTFLSVRIEQTNICKYMFLVVYFWVNGWIKYLFCDSNRQQVQFAERALMKVCKVNTFDNNFSLFIIFFALFWSHYEHMGIL